MIEIHCNTGHDAASSRDPANGGDPMTRVAIGFVLYVTVTVLACAWAVAPY